MDGITLSRQLSPEEAMVRSKVARRTMMLPVLGYALGGGLVILVLAIGLLTDWSIGLMVGVALAFAVIAAGAVALGLMLGNDVLRRQARYELGETSVLTVTWGGDRARVTAENFQRSFGYREIQWVRQVESLVVLKFPMQWHASPYVMAFPPDFVPDEAKRLLGGAGVRIS